MNEIKLYSSLVEDEPDRQTTVRPVKGRSTYLYSRVPASHADFPGSIGLYPPLPAQMASLTRKVWPLRYFSDLARSMNDAGIFDLDGGVQDAEPLLQESERLLQQALPVR